LKTWKITPPPPPSPSPHTFLTCLPTSTSPTLHLTAKEKEEKGEEKAEEVAQNVV
jgi:hypothetical protein